MKYKVRYDMKNCIGAGACVAAFPGRWELNADNKAVLKGGTEKEDGWFELEIEESELEQMKTSAEVCPVRVIKILDENGNDLVL
ncbi:ferredoxin [archaeon]|nr:ferredoxin [archaeon]